MPPDGIFIKRGAVDCQYRSLRFDVSEREHRYGPNVHLLSDPYLLTLLARLSSPACLQPEISFKVRELYRALGKYLANSLLPREHASIPTRMAAEHKGAAYDGDVLARGTRIVLVSLARAGILPATVLFELFCDALGPENVRIDHVFINRSTDSSHRVIGADIAGSKVGGSIENAFVIVPDPMGATGNSFAKTVAHYAGHAQGRARQWISLNLIVAPEYVQRVKRDLPEAAIFSLRLDRGLSTARALGSAPGTYPEEERGLDDRQYIVPGAGGVGELLNNSFV